MKNYLTTLLAGVLFISSPCSMAQQASESDCFFLNMECKARARINQRNAEQKRAEDEVRARYLEEKSRRDAEHEEAVRRSVEAARQRDAERAAAAAEKAESDRVKREIELAQWKENQARKQAALDAAHAAEMKRESAERATVERAASALKARCGDDYRTPRIGMTIERARECLGPMKMVGQLNRSEGVATQYRVGSVWLNVLQGHVIAWGK